MTPADQDRFKAMLAAEAKFWNFPAKRYDDALILGYWTALRDLSIETVEAARARWRKVGRTFPKPSDLRPKDDRGNARAPSAESERAPARDHARDYWRSMAVAEAKDALDLRFRSDGDEILQYLLRSHPNFAEALRMLLDELCDQEARGGRTDGMMLGCRRRAAETARYFQHDARAEIKRRAEINHRPQRTAALPLTADTEASAGDLRS